MPQVPDERARIWSCKGKLITTISGHNDRISRLAFHPSGRFLATASFDQSWCLWNIEKTIPVLSSNQTLTKNLKNLDELIQRNYIKSIYSLAFHCDGSLLGSGGMDGIGKIWDLRTGNHILTLDGHIKPILTLDFSPNGYHLITGSVDNSCQLWDLRKAKNKLKILAHKNLVSHVKYHPTAGKYFVTASYDNELKIWSGYDFHLLSVLRGHENKIMGLDIHPSIDLIASVGYDRMLKFWSPSSLIK